MTAIIVFSVYFIGVILCFRALKNEYIKEFGRWEGGEVINTYLFSLFSFLGLCVVLINREIMDSLK